MKWYIWPVGFLSLIAGGIAFHEGHYFISLVNVAALIAILALNKGHD